MKKIRVQKNKKKVAVSIAFKLPNGEQKEITKELFPEIYPTEDLMNRAIDDTIKGLEFAADYFCKPTESMTA